ncbi:hypothetical protein ACLOJK_024616 [Asimina triloba]
MGVAAGASSRVKKESVPESYILPPNKCPGNDTVRPCCTVPVIDLEGAGSNGWNQAGVIEQILRASKEFEFFQAIERPQQGVAGLIGARKKPDPRVLSLMDMMSPTCPYREYQAGLYIRALALRILELISQGLDLETHYFNSELSRATFFAVNHYPTCADPSLTLGLPKHCDPNLITFLLQGDLCGLQVYKDGEWMTVEALPNSFVVNLGHQMESAQVVKVMTLEKGGLGFESHEG